MSKYKLKPEGKELEGDVDEVVEALARRSPGRITDGEDPLADNYRRAEKAALAIQSYASDGGGSEDIETHIGDLMSDLQHLFDFLGIDLTVSELADTKSYHYDAEIDGVL